MQDVARATCLTHPCPLPSRPIVRLRAAPRPYRLHCQLTRPFPPSLVFISFGALALALALSCTSWHQVGIITYAEGVELHEPNHPLGPRVWRLPSSIAEGSSDALHAILGIRSPDAAADDAHAAAASAPSQQPHAGMMMSAAGGAFGMPSYPGAEMYGPPGGGGGAAGGPPPGYSSGYPPGGGPPGGQFRGGQGGYPPVGGGGPPGYGGYPGGAPPGAGGYPGGPPNGAYPGAPPGYGGYPGGAPPTAGGYPGGPPAASAAPTMSAASAAAAAEEARKDACRRFFVRAADLDVKAVLAVRQATCAPPLAAAAAAEAAGFPTPQQAASGGGSGAGMHDGTGGGAMGDGLSPGAGSMGDAMQGGDGMWGQQQQQYGMQGGGFGGAAGGGSPGAPPPHHQQQQFGMPQAGAPGRIPGRIAAAAAAAAKAVAAGAESGAAEGKRAPRCTGSALAAATSVLEGCAPGGSARAMVFTGGPSVGGEGAIVGEDLTEQLRSHVDILNRRDSTRTKRITEHYQKLAVRAARKGFAIDLVGASLEETGLHEMRACVRASGGVALQAETFGAPHLRASLRRLFATDESSGEGEELRLGYSGTLELRASKECERAELLGFGSSASAIPQSGVVDTLMGRGGDEEGEAEVTEAGDARSFTWRVGSLNAHYAAAIQLTRAKESLAGPPRDAAYLQLSVAYTPAAGGRRMRVTTLRLPRLTHPVPPMQLLPAFDQQAAAALMVRLALRDVDDGAPPAEMLTTIDKSLIKTMKALCDYRKGDPGTVMLPPPCAQLPGLVFHLRRSPVVRTTGTSPDESAYFRLLVGSLPVFSTLVIVQPTLVGYELGRPAQALPLDPAAMHPERSLLLDTFLNVLLCHGASIAQLRRASKDAGGGGGGGPANAALSALEEAAHSDLEARELQRFPAPETFECDQYSSKARYVVQKLNPDVPLSTFLAGLYKAIVS